MRIRQYIELAVNGCDCSECLEAIIRTAEEESAAELAALRAENEKRKPLEVVCAQSLEREIILRAENERLREALSIAECYSEPGSMIHFACQEALK